VRSSATTPPTKFFVPGVPKTKNNKRAFSIGGKARVVPGKDAAKKQAAFQAVAIEHAPKVPTQAPVKLVLGFAFTPPKGYPKWKREAALAGEWQKTTKPDVSRLVTFCEDCLSGLFFVDDAQVVEIHARCFFSERPGTSVEVITIPQALSPREKKAARAAVAVGEAS